MHYDMKRICRTAGVLALCFVLPGCGEPAGTPCSITGSGFTASHDCATKCLSRWSVNCPDGSRVQPAVCAGEEGCKPGDCPDGQICYHFDDPFEVQSYCIPDTVCRAATDAAARARWEQEAMAVAAALRAEYEAKSQRQSGKPTALAAPISDPPAEDTDPP
jgi:hypothetical protein